jgi:cobaltochelatase CobS
MMIKHSQRTVKCKYCGVREFYWYHNDENDHSAKHECMESTCAGYGRQVTWELRQSSWTDVHNCRGRMAPPKQQPNRPVDVGVYVDQPAAEVDLSLVKQMIDDAIAGFDPVSVDTIVGVVNRVLADQQPIKVEVGNVEIGYRQLPSLCHRVMPKVLKYLDAGFHVMMVGPAGTGKSYIAEQAAEALGLQYAAKSMSPTLPLSDIFGYRDANGNYQTTVFRTVYEFGGVFCFDEIDNSHPSILAAINMALANKACSFPDGMVAKHPEFRCVGAANTFGTGADRQYVGRQTLDAATLDRFWTVDVSYDEALETELALSQGGEAEQTTELLTFIRSLRQAVVSTRLPVIFSQRASLEGSRALARGIPWEDVISDRIRKGTTDSDWSKLTMSVRIPS